jgi:hypothetical protein
MHYWSQRAVNSGHGYGYFFFVKEEAIIVMLTSRNKTMEQVMLVDDGD